jgi:DNA polymerase I
VIEKSGHTVIYGDTDSCMVQLDKNLDREGTIAAARAIEKTLNASYQAFAEETLGADVHFFSIKFEKIYARFFQAGRKKRYAGSLVWKEGKDVAETDIVGFEIKRSDTPQITKFVQKRVMEMILDGKEKAEVRAFLGDVIKKYRAGKYPLDEVGIPGGIGKSLTDYDTDDAQVRGAKYANEYLHTEFGKGSKPKRVYIKAVTAKYPKTDVLCFEYADQVPPEFVVDWELMLSKTIEQPITRIIEALGWKWSDMDPSHTTLAQWGFG